MPLAYSLLSFIPNKRIRQITTANNVITSYGATAIRNMRSGSGNAQNLFGQMMNTSDKQEQKMLTDANVREEARTFIIAGSDTTAITLTYLIWAVLKQPDLQRLLEEEVAGLSEELSLDELADAPLMNSVITETLRLYGAAPGALPRVVPSQGLRINGHHIPGGVVVNTQAYTTHRDPRIFSEPFKYVHIQPFLIAVIKPANRPRFDGFRFMDKAYMTTERKAAYMPFGGASRSCLGLHLAYMEIRLATALFFRHCCGARLSDNMRDEMMEMENMFLISPKGHCCNITLT